MTKLGRDLIKAADEALAIARGELDPKTYRVHHAPDDDADVTHFGRGMKVFHKSGSGRMEFRRAGRSGSHKRPIMARKTKKK